MESVFFLLVAFIAIVSGILVVTCKNPINNAISLVMTFVCLAAFYIMLNAPFMAAIQIMVYAGAIMVLIIFVIMLLNLGPDVKKSFPHGLVWAFISAALILFESFYLLVKSSPDGVHGFVTTDKIQSIGHTELIGRTMFTDYLLPFEITSILLLVAIVGAVILVKRDVAK